MYPRRESTTAIARFAPGSDREARHTEDDPNAPGPGAGELPRNGGGQRQRAATRRVDAAAQRDRRRSRGRDRDLARGYGEGRSGRAEAGHRGRRRRVPGRPVAELAVGRCRPSTSRRRSRSARRCGTAAGDRAATPLGQPRTSTGRSRLSVPPSPSSPTSLSPQHFTPPPRGQRAGVAGAGGDRGHAAREARRRRPGVRRRCVVPSPSCAVVVVAPALDAAAGGQSAQV